MDFIYVMFMLGFIFKSIHFTHITKKFVPYVYIMSTIMGMFSFAVFLVLLVDMITGIVDSIKCLSTTGVCQITCKICFYLSFGLSSHSSCKILRCLARKCFHLYDLQVASGCSIISICLTDFDLRRFLLSMLILGWCSIRYHFLHFLHSNLSEYAEYLCYLQDWRYLLGD